MATIKLIDDQVDEVTLIDSNNKYKNGQRAKDGKTFSRYRYNSTVFTVDNDSPFIQHQIDGNVSSVKLVEGTREVDIIDADGVTTTQTLATLTFDSHTSFQQVERRAAHKAKIKRYDTIATAPVTDSLLNELLAP